MNAAFDSMGAPKTLYVGNLSHQATEELVVVLFNQIGPVKVTSSGAVQPDRTGQGN